MERDPEFTLEDASIAIALKQIEGDSCGHCGVDKDIATDPTLHWGAEQWVCRVCAAGDRAAREFAKQYKDSPPARDGLQFQVVPIVDRRLIPRT